MLEKRCFGSSEQIFAAGELSMIKSLLDADENPPPGTKVIIEDTVVNPSVQLAGEPEPIKEYAENEEILEIPGLDAEPENASELFDAAGETPKYQPVAGTIPDRTQIRTEQIQTEQIQTEQIRTEQIPNGQPENAQTPDEQTPDEQTQYAQNESFLFQSITAPPASDFAPESQVETIRKSGLAYAAAITLFASIAFLLLIGWFVDLLLGTSPYGAVTGIVLGSIIGFLQFFRITSQILKNKD